MPSCLGLYIEEHLIKYAKVSKEREDIKVEAFGVKFYDKIGEAIDKIVEETYSQRTPISVNLSEEMYNYFSMFSLLTKNDLQKAVKTEFDSYCTDRGYNPNVFESKYAIVNEKNGKDRIKVIHISENKIELNKTMQYISDYKLTNVSPISMSIPNLLDSERLDNAIIVNMENITTITTILEKQVYNVDKLEHGSNDILSKINLKENSYSKAYEICKNTTIYTSEGKGLQDEEINYLEDIMPTLYEVVSGVMKIINTQTEKIQKIYITGSMALINNIDLYFQEYIPNVECEILKPYFIENTRDLSINDYVEANSAISLALMGLNVGITGMNFKQQSFADKIPSWLKIEVSPEKTKKEKKNSGGFFTWDFGQQLDKTEISLIRTTVGLALLITIYSVFSGTLASQMNAKKNDADKSIRDTNSQIRLADADNEKVKEKISEYTKMMENLRELSDRITDKNRTRNAIPNLLNQIMSVIPENVQLTSIENTSDRHIVIKAKSNKYEQLGYLKAKLKTEVILTNVISTAGEKEDNVVNVIIEGDLP